MLRLILTGFIYLGDHLPVGLLAGRGGRGRKNLIKFLSFTADSEKDRN